MRAEKEGKMKKRITAVLMTLALTMTMFAGCGSDNAEEKSSNLEGSCEEILAKVYENADLDADLREAMNYYQTVSIDEASEEYILGTTEVAYTDSVYSAPMMSSVAYQCVLLRLESDADVDAAKQLLLDNANPIKWVCVEAESVVVENVGDVVLYIMADAQTTDAVKTAFLALGE